MRVLFSTTAGAGHFGPMVPIARECGRAGHAVLVAAPTSFASAVQSSGLPFAAFPDVPSEQMGAIFGQLPSLSNEEADRIVITEMFGRLDAQAALPSLLELVESWRPDVVVREPAEFGSLAAAARFDVPSVQVAIGLGAMVEATLDALDAPLRELDSLAGLEERGTDRVVASPTLSSVPPSFDDAVTGSAATRGRVWRYRVPAPIDGPALPTEFGDPALPLVYVTFGSVSAGLSHFAAAYPAAIQAMSGLDVRVLLTTGTGLDVGTLGPLPANIHATQWWPQDSAMRVAAAAVGHGGFGTTMSALLAAVPQVVLPLFASDQFLNGQRVEQVGAGRCLLGGVGAIEQLPALVSEILTQPRYRTAASAIAAESAALPDVSEMVSVLESTAGQ